VLPTSAKDQLTLLTYSDHKSVVLSAAELKAIPHISVTIHNPHTNAEEVYSGIRLSDLLAKMGAPLGSELRGRALANYIVATGSDGYQAVLALAEVDPSFHPGEVLVADTLNGKPLNRPWIQHSDITSGGVLHFQLGPQPNKQWGTEGLPKP